MDVDQARPSQCKPKAGRTPASKQKRRALLPDVRPDGTLEPISEPDNPISGPHVQGQAHAQHDHHDAASDSSDEIAVGRASRRRRHRDTASKDSMQREELEFEDGPAARAKRRHCMVSEDEGDPDSPKTRAADADAASDATAESGPASHPDADQADHPEYHPAADYHDASTDPQSEGIRAGSARDRRSLHQQPHDHDSNPGMVPSSQHEPTGGAELEPSSDGAGHIDDADGRAESEEAEDKGSDYEDAADDDDPFAAMLREVTGPQPSKPKPARPQASKPRVSRSKDLASDTWKPDKQQVHASAVRASEASRGVGAGKEPSAGPKIKHPEPPKQQKQADCVEGSSRAAAATREAAQTDDSQPVRQGSRATTAMASASHGGSGSGKEPDDSHTLHADASHGPLNTTEINAAMPSSVKAATDKQDCSSQPASRLSLRERLKRLREAGASK